MLYVRHQPCGEKTAICQVGAYDQGYKLHTIGSDTMDILDQLTVESGHIARSEIDIAGMSPTARSPALY